MKFVQSCLAEDEDGGTTKLPEFLGVGIRRGDALE